MSNARKSSPRNSSRVPHAQPDGRKGSGIVGLGVPLELGQVIEAPAGRKSSSADLAQMRVQ